MNDVKFKLSLEGAQQVSSAVERVSASVQGLSAHLGAMGHAAVAFAAVRQGMQTVGEAAKALAQAQVQAEKLSQVLSFSSTRTVAQEMGFLRDTTDRLGLSFGSTAAAYAKFAAAARGTSLEGDAAQQAFTAVAKASAVMGLSAAESEGALLALQQMISKGTVSAEELRGQLGERLPGAFQIAARSMGVTTAELGKMLEQGAVATDQFLPRFAAQMEKEFGGAAEKAGQRLDAQINRTANAWDKLKQSVAQAGVGDFIGGQMALLADAMDDVSDSMASAQREGGGFLSQMGAGAAAVARFLNPLNAVSYTAQGVGEQLKAAEAELKRLQEGLASNPGNILLPAAIKDAQRLVDKLREAEVLRRSLDQTDAETRRLGLGGSTENAAETARFSRQAAAATAQGEIFKKYRSDAEKLRAELDAVRVAFGGVIPADLEKRIRDQFIKPMTASSAALESSRDVAKQWADTIEDAQKVIADNEAQTLGLTKAQALLVRYLQSPAYLQASEGMRQVAVQTLIAAHNSEVDAAAKQAQAKALAEAEAAGQRYLKSIADQTAAAAQDAQQMRDQAIELSRGKAAREAVVQQRLDDAAAQAQQMATASQWLEGNTAETLALQKLAGQLADVARARREMLTAEAGKEARDASTQAARQAAEDWQRSADSIRGALTDAIRRGLESGKNPIKAFGDALANEVKARLLTAIAEGLSAQIMGALGLQIAGAAGGGSGSLLQGLNRAGSLYQAYNGQGLVGSAVSTVAASPYAYGAAIGTTNVGAGSQAAMLAAQTGEFGAAGTVATSQAAAGAGAGAASWASWASTWGAAIAAGIWKANQDYSDGFRRDQARDVSNSLFGSNFVGDFGAAGGIESAKANFLSQLGFSDRLADLLSGATAIAALFGRAQPRIESAGVTGTIGAGGFTGNAYADVLEKGGLFRSDKRYTEFAAVGAEMERFLDSAAAGIYDKAKDFGEALGLPVEQLAGVTADIRVALGDDAAKNQEALTTALAGYGDALVATYAEAVAPLTNYGESTAQTIERVGAAILGVNGVLSTLGVTSLAASVEGGKAAVALQDLFGGLAGLQRAAGSYLQNFYSDNERTQLTLQALGEALGEVGQALPMTRDGFRALVDAQDLNTTAGRETFAVLMSVADAFAAVVPAARSAADVAQERAGLEQQLLQVQGNTTALRQLELEALDPSNRALKELIYSLEDTAAAAQAAADAADALKTSLADMLGQLKDAAAAAMSAVEASISAAKKAVQDEYNAKVAVIDDALDAARARYEAVADRVAAEREAAQAIYDAKAAAIGTALDALDAAAKAQAATYKTQSKALEAERAAAQDAYKVAAASLSATIKTAGETVSRLRGLNDSLKSTLSALSLSGSEGASRAAAQAQISQALAVAKASGVLPDAESLKDALAAVAKPSEDLFASFEDYARDFYRTQIDLSDLQRFAGDQLDEAQTLLDVATAQKEALDTAHEANIQRLDGLREALDAANELFREQTEIQRELLNAQLDGARSQFDSTSAVLDAQLEAAAKDLDTTTEALQQQKDALAEQLALDLKVFDDILEAARAQYNAIMGVDTSVKSVATAIGSLGTALQAYATAAGKGPVTTGGVGGTPTTSTPTNQWVTSGQVQTFLDALGAVAVKTVGAAADAAIIQATNGATFTAGDAADYIRTNAGTNPNAVATQAQQTGISLSNADALAGFTSGTLAALTGTGTVGGYSAADVRWFVNDMLAKENARAIYDRAVSEKITSATLDAIMGWAPGTAAAWAVAQGLPAFAKGTNYVPTDMVAQIHQGERIIPAADNAALFDALGSGARRDAVLVAEIKALRAEVSALRSQQQAASEAGVVAANKTARVLDKWDTDGMPPTTT